MKKTVLLICILLAVAAVYAINGLAKHYRKAPLKPLPENIAKDKLFKDRSFYEDERVVIYQRDLRAMVINKQTGQKIKINYIKKVERIRDKPAEAPPLVGVAVKDGIKLVNDDETNIIELEPRFGILASYPNPGNERDKIIIDKSTNTLYLYKDGRFYKSYPVATGKDPRYTPEGRFKIVNKVKDNGDELKPQLGDRWIGLGVPYAKDMRAEKDKRAPVGGKYGIHGTNEPDSIGKYASGGCIRMDNEQVAELFELVEVNMPVEIRGIDQAPDTAPPLK
ncbi:L,D-transpeptidase [Desulfoscipio geothermicus]|uniref:L,D-transpeptidase catalytic domain n=1 Tax=Desulfoscipio geothermicus DSM 3669 TaxID=1121426 RepID=A0A1I6D4E2_9FIRM|nr:L,D-transpeptidase [Desulfoscipio geothermicus]SFR00260.1 L,D-transpeptidase catalytic domain [Desulfoscipio geothermicus DSM 3669]